MLKGFLQSLDGASTFPALILVLFFAAFTGVLVWTWRLDRDLIAKLKRLPLEAEDSKAELKDRHND